MFMKENICKKFVRKDATYEDQKKKKKKRKKMKFKIK